MNTQKQLRKFIQRFQLWLKKWNLPKSGSLFSSILLILCLLVVCMLSYMTFFMDKFVLQAQNQELHRSNLAMLERVNDSFTQLTTDLEQQVRFFLTDQNILHHLLSNEFCTSETRIAILQSMKNYVALTPEVSSLCLYAPLTNTVLSSDGFLNDRYDSTIAPVLTRFESQVVPRSAPDLRLSSVVQQEHLYILIDFIPSERLGCFVFQVDLHALDLTLSQELPPILVADSTGTLLLEGSSAATAEHRFDLSETALYYQNPSEPASQKTHYRAYNDLLAWNLLMEIPAVRSSGFSTFWGPLLPFLFILLLLGALGSYCITKKIYAPIDRLMTLAANNNGLTPPPGTEISFLETTFQDILHANQELHATCGTQKMEMRRCLFRAAISGNLPVGLDSASIPSVIPEGLLYVALIHPGAAPVLPSPLHSPPAAPLPVLKDLLAQTPACLCYLEDSADTLILILHSPHPQNMVIPQSPQSCLDTFLNLSRQKLGHPVLCGLGSGCTSLHQLKESYENALQSLRYNIYLSSNPDPATAHSLKNKVLADQLNQILDQPSEDLQSQAARILQITEQDAEDDVDRIQRYELAQNLISEKLLLWEANDPETEREDEDDPVIQDREQFLEYCTLALEAGQSVAGKKKYRYMEESKKFIQEHYMKSDLSANDISAHVGISPSYFSSLFNELMKESVTSYLNRIRVEQAKKLLSNTKMPIKEIGTSCGFASANVFGRVFKKYTQQSPSQYRDSHAARQEGVVPNGQIM